MAKSKGTVFFCQNCGYETPKWMGQCPGCGEWNTLVEEIRDTKSNQSSPKVERQIGELKKIKEIKSGEKERYDTGIGELNRVLGGGLVKGSLTLISGDPGIGKSTLLLQTANNISKKIWESFICFWRRIRRTNKNKRRQIKS